MYRNILLWLHIAAAGGWLGANLVQLSVGRRLARAGGEIAAAWFDTATLLAQRYYNVVGTLLGVTGVLLVLHGGYAWTTPFVMLGLATLVVGALLGIVHFAPTGRRLAAAARAGEDAAASSTFRAYALGAVVDTTLVLVTMLAMVSRWGA